MKSKLDIVVLASGSETGGGSGYAQLLKASKDKAGYRVAAVLSNHPEGGVFDITHEYYKKENGFTEFYHLPNPSKALGAGWKNEENAHKLQRYYDFALNEVVDDAALIAMSGWMFLFDSEKYNPSKVINIHPGPTQDGYGGDKMHGDHVHEAIWRDFQAGKIDRTMVTMHYATREYDKGPVIGQFPVSLEGCTCPDDVGSRVNKLEHIVQWQVTDLVANRKIQWSGREGEEVHSPTEYQYGKKFPLKGTLPENIVEFDGTNGEEFSGLTLAA